jgi:F-type H+-transporting ATPase subunit alpha
MHVADQVVAIYAGTSGAFDEVPVPKVREAEARLLQFVSAEHGAFRDRLVETKALTEEIEAELKKILQAFRERTKAETGKGAR